MLRNALVLLAPPRFFRWYALSFMNTTTSGLTRVCICFLVSYDYVRSLLIARDLPPIISLTKERFLRSTTLISLRLQFKNWYNKTNRASFSIPLLLVGRYFWFILGWTGDSPNCHNFCFTLISFFLIVHISTYMLSNIYTSLSYTAI